MLFLQLLQFDGRPNFFSFKQSACCLHWPSCFLCLVSAVCALPPFSQFDNIILLACSRGVIKREGAAICSLIEQQTTQTQPGTFSLSAVFSSPQDEERAAELKGVRNLDFKLELSAKLQILGCVYLIRGSNHLSWLFSMRRCSSSAQSSPLLVICGSKLKYRTSWYQNFML